MLSAPHLAEICREDSAVEIAHKSELEAFVFELMYLIWREKKWTFGTCILDYHVGPVEGDKRCG